MKYGIFILFIGLSVIMFSCTDPANLLYSEYKVFPQEERLYGKEIPIDTVLFRYPFRITVKDSVAIVMDLHNMDHYLHAFMYPTWVPIASFGHRGNAPDELLSADNIQFVSLDSLWVLDANKMQITRWSIQPYAKIAEQVEVIELADELIRSLDFHVVDSGFYVTDYSGRHRLWRVDRSGKPIQAIGAIPTVKDNWGVSPPALAQAWRSFMDYNPTVGLLVMATQLGEVLEVYNVRKNTQNVLYGPKGEPQFITDGGEHSAPTGIMGFSDVKITDHYIYAVFQGVSFKDKYNAFSRGTRLEDGGRFIYVFDLECNPVKKYILNHAIYGIDVNEETKTIIATKVDSDSPLLEFKM